MEKFSLNQKSVVLAELLHPTEEQGGAEIKHEIIRDIEDPFMLFCIREAEYRLDCEAEDREADGDTVEVTDGMVEALARQIYEKCYDVERAVSLTQTVMDDEIRKLEGWKLQQDDFSDMPAKAFAGKLRESQGEDRGVYIKWLEQHPDFAEEVLLVSPYLIQFLPDAPEGWCLLVADKIPLRFIPRLTAKVCRLAVNAEPSQIKYVPKELQDRRMCFDVVRSNGLTLRHIASPDYDICLEAVREDGRAIKFCPKEFISVQIVMEALRTYPEAVDFTTPAVARAAKSISAKLG